MDWVVGWFGGAIHTFVCEELRLVKGRVRGEANCAASLAFTYRVA